MSPERYAIAQPLADISLKHMEDANPVLFKGFKQFLGNADIAYRASQFYEDTMSEYVSDESRMTRYVSNKTSGHGEFE